MAGSVAAPFTAAGRQAGYRYHLSIVQAEFSLTQVLDRPVHGRLFFEKAIRENLDLGRPEEVQLIFNRRINRATPGSFCTRILRSRCSASSNRFSAFANSCCAGSTRSGASGAW